MPRRLEVIVTLLACTATTLPGFQVRDGWNEVLRDARVRQTNRTLLKQSAFYTCLETISRMTAKSSTAKLRRQDVVQVDVGVGDGQEIYSWPGAQSFAQQNLPELVGHGLLTTGMFHSFARNLFVSNHGTMHLVGTGRVQGREALHYSYTVPHLENAWGVNWLGVRGQVEQAGEFWVDAATFRLLLMRIRAEQIPMELRIQSMQISIDFQLASFNETPSLLPLSATTAVVDSDGKVYEDSTTYSQCHVFATESKLASSNDNLRGELAQLEVHRHTIPPGRTLQLVLKNGLQCKSATVGDLIIATLEKPVKISDTLTIPTGSIARGRIRRIEPLEDSPGTMDVGIEFSEIIDAANSYSFLANLSAVSPLAGVTRAVTISRALERSTLAGALTNVETSTILPDNVSGIGSFFLEGRSQLPAGFRMTWTTLNVSSPKSQN